MKLLGKSPIGFTPKALLSTAVHGAMDAGVGVGGMATARLVRGKLNIEGNTIKGGAVETLVGVLGGAALARFVNQDVARAFVQGALMGPIITAVKSRNVPAVSAALGDEGELPLFGGEYELGGQYELPPGTIGDEEGALAGAGADREWM